MATLKQIYALAGDTAQAQYAALNQAAFDLIEQAAFNLIEQAGVVPAGVGFHAYAIKHWPKQVGPKPTPAMLALPYIIDPVRRGGRETMQFSMGLRPEGVTPNEYVNVWFSDGHRPGGAAHNNIAKYTDQVRGGIAGACWFARVEGSSTGHSKRLWYVISDKGMAHLAKRLAALTGVAAPAPVAKPVTARKRNAKPAPVTDTVPVEQPVEHVTLGVTLATPADLAVLADKFNS